MENEIWIEAYNFPNYEVSNMGRIRNAKTEKVLKLACDGNLYNMVRIYHDKKKYTKRVARLIWNSFNKCNCAKTIDHINRVRNDDRLENLRCVGVETQMFNVDRFKGENRYNLTPELKGEIQRDFEGGMNYYQIQKKYKLPYNYLRTTLIRGSWKKYV